MTLSPLLLLLCTGTVLILSAVSMLGVIWIYRSSSSSSKFHSIRKYAESRFPSQTNFLKRRISPEGFLGLHLTAGLVMCLVGAWAFAKLAEDVVNKESLVLWDDAIAGWFHQNTTPKLTALMQWVTDTGDVKGIILLSVPFVVYFLYRRHWYWLLGLIVSVPGGGALNLLMKALFHRQRPVFSDPIVSLESFSFPSGHAMTATLCYGFIAVFFVTRKTHWMQRVFLVSICLSAIFTISLTRVYLGAHFLSDVLAGMAAGTLWLAISLTGVETFRRFRTRSNRNGTLSGKDRIAHRDSS